MKNVLFSMALILGIVFISGCEELPSHPVKVGLCEWPGYEPIFLAAQMNMFDRPVKVVRFSSPSKAYKAFKSGAIDVVGITVDELLKYADYGSVPKMFLILDVSHGGDAIVTKPSIKTLKEIKGKTIAIEPSILGQYMLHRALDKAKLTASDVKIVNIEVVEHPKAFSNNKADAFVTFEPSRGALIKQGGNLVFDTTMIPNEIVDALAADEKTWREDKEAIKSIKRGWYKALDFIHKDPQKAYQIMGGFESISAEQFEENLKGLTLGTKELNNIMIQQEKLVESLQKMQDVMLEKKILKNRIDPFLFIGK